MPITINELAIDRRTVTLPFAGDKLTVTYRPNALTPAREMFLLRSAAESSEESEDDEELQRAERNITRQINTFEELVEAWDFLGPLARKQGERFDIPRDQQDQENAAAYCELHGAELLVNAGQPVPIQGKYLRLIPSNFLMSVVRLINEDMRPNPKRKRHSDDG